VARRFFPATTRISGSVNARQEILPTTLDEVTS